MKAARLVFIRAGRSESVVWEIGEAVKVSRPEKLVLFFLGRTRREYAAIAEALRDVLPDQLPI